MLISLRRLCVSPKSLLMFAVLVTGLGLPNPAMAQLQIWLDGSTNIVDGGPGDTDLTVNGKIDFSGVYGNAGYMVSGRLQESPTWPVGSTVSQQLTSPVYSLTLTNFVAEAISTSILNTPLALRFQSDPFLGLFGPGLAVDSISAEVGNSLSTPVFPSTDLLISNMSIIGDASVSTVLTPATGAPLPQGNPFHPGPGTTPYLVSGDGPTALPPMINPTIYGLIQLQLGQSGDQFIMPSSYDIGFSAVPEPATAVLFGMGLLGLAACRARRARVR